jgi:hypothetical protein
MADALKASVATKGAAGAKPNAQGKRSTNAKPIFRHTKFEGRCDELKGHVYDCKGGMQADQYAKTTKEICNYVGRTYKQGADVKMAIDQMDTGLPAIIQPADPPLGATLGVTKVWERSWINMSSASISVKPTYKPCIH